MAGLPGNPLKAARRTWRSFEDRFASAKAWRGVRASASAISSVGRVLATPSTRCESSSGDIRNALHLADGRRHCCRISSVEALAQARGITSDCGDSRPGYDRQAHAARAMGWLRRFVRPSSQAKNWTDWSAPAILLLRLPPDPTSATGLRAHDPNWHERFHGP